MNTILIIITSLAVGFILGMAATAELYDRGSIVIRLPRRRRPEGKS